MIGDEALRMTTDQATMDLRETTLKNGTSPHNVEGKMAISPVFKV